jgi:hypothetical protein
MADTAVPVTAHPDGKNPILSRSLLQMWVEHAPERLTFVGTEAGDQFKVEQIPPKGKLSVRGGSGSGGQIGTLTKQGNSGRGSLKLS